jgi:hypothetical protein
MGLLDGPLKAVMKAVTGVLGTTATLTRTTRQYDPLHSESFDAKTTHTLRLLRGAEEFGLINADSTNKREADVLVDAVSVEGVAVEPSNVTDTLTVGNVLWRIVKVKPVYGSAEAVAYTVTLNR